MAKYAFSIINESIKKTEERLFPIKIREWLKLGFVNMLAGTNTGANSGSGSSSYNMPSTGNYTAGLNPATGMVTGMPLLIPLLVIFPIGLILLLLYLNALFIYVFIDSVKGKKTRIKKSIKRVKKQSWSLFKIKLLIMVLTILAIIILLLLFLGTITLNHVASIIFGIMLLAVLLIPIILLLAIVNFVINQFLIPISYFNKSTIPKAWTSFKNLWKKEWVEIVIFYVMLLLLDLIVITASVIIGIIYALILIIIAAPILLFYNPLWFIIFFVTFLILISVYLLNVLTLPFSVFRTNYILTFLGKIDKTIKY